MTDRGDWSKLTDYLNEIKIGGTSKPKMIVLSQDNLLDITGSVQKAKLYKDHPQTDIVDRAAAAGYSVNQLANGDFEFS